MTAALQGFNVEWIKNFFIKRNSQNTHFHTNPAAIADLISDLKMTMHSKYKRTFAWIEKMLLIDRNGRPLAAQVLDMITYPETNDIDATPNLFCGICCVPDHESDSSDSLADYVHTEGASMQPEPRSDESKSVKSRNSTAGEGSHAKASSRIDVPYVPSDSSLDKSPRSKPEEDRSELEAPSATTTGAGAQVSLKSSASLQRREPERLEASTKKKASPDTIAILPEQLGGKEIVKKQPSQTIESASEFDLCTRIDHF